MVCWNDGLVPTPHAIHHANTCWLKGLSNSVILEVSKFSKIEKLKKRKCVCLGALTHHAIHHANTPCTIPCGTKTSNTPCTRPSHVHTTSLMLEGLHTMFFIKRPSNKCRISQSFIVLLVRFKPHACMNRVTAAVAVSATHDQTAAAVAVAVSATAGSCEHHEHAHN